jgi:CHAT domain-containing protein/Tfp pilus assembly protein PilF
MPIIGAVTSSYGQDLSTGSERLEEAKAMYDSENYEKSSELYEQLQEEFCQTSVDVSELAICIRAKFGKANIARRLGNDEEALVLAEDILEDLDNAQFPEERELRAKGYRLHLYLSFGFNQLEKADEWAKSIEGLLDEANENSKVSLLSLSSLGYYEDEMGNYEDAINYYTKALEIAEILTGDENVDKTLLRLRNNLGVAYKRIGRLEDAKTEQLKSLELALGLYGKNNEEEATTYINLGSIYFSQGDIGTAAQYFQQAVDIYKSLKGNFSSELGASLNNLAVVYFHLDNYELSAQYFEEAQRIKEENLGLDDPDTAVGYSNLASIHIINENYEAAERNYRRALEVLENIYGPNHPNLLDQIIGLGDFFNNQLNQPGEARIHYESALSIATDRLGAEHPVVTDIYLQLAQSFLDENKYSEAEEYIDKTIEAIYGSFDLSRPFDSSKSIIDPNNLINALTLKSHVLANKSDNIKIEEYETSFMALNWGLDLLDRTQRSFKNETSKIQIIEKNYSMYSSAIELLSIMHNESGDSVYLDRAFEIVEKSRSRVALELIQRVNARKFAGVPDNIIQQEEILKDRIVNMQQEIYTEESKGLERDSLMVRAMRDSIFYYNRELDNFAYTLEEEYPSYYYLKYDQSIIDREEAQALLDQDEVVLSYIFGSETVFVLILDKGDINLVELDVSPDVENQILSLNDYVLNNSTEEYKRVAYSLYKQLIEPVESFITDKEVLVMADQFLHYLPFEMLLNEIPDHDRFSSYPFLVKDNEYSYIPSLTLLQEMNSHKEDDPRNLLAVAPFSSDMESTDRQLMDHQYADRANPLYLTQYETVTISSRFQDKTSLTDYFSPQRSELLLGAQATYSRFSNSDLSDYDYIHFATHAFINEESPEFSAILMYPEEGNTGATYVGDIYSLELDANLVVLGACQTGLGSVHKGEGMIGFTRAFIYAGASNLAVSMWRVSDQPTAYLMIDFYDYIQQGYDYSDALRRAKLNMISTPQFANPVNWAAFTLTGR